MKAKVGDHIVIRSHRVGQIDRDGEILEVRGVDGGPPYVVRWLEDEHVALFFPGSDAEIRSPARAPGRKPHHRGPTATA